MKSGESTAIFDENFKRYYKKCVLFAKSFVYDDLAAESIASESMMVLWEKTNGDDALASRPVPFLFGVIRNKALHFLREQNSLLRLKGEIDEERQKEIILRINSLEACDPHILYSADVQRIISDCLAELGSQTEKVFLLSRFEGMTYKEIAQELGISEKTVEYHLSKAIKKLRVALIDYLPVISIFLGL